MLHLRRSTILRLSAIAALAVALTGPRLNGAQTAPPQRPPHSAHNDGSKDCGQCRNSLRTWWAIGSAPDKGGKGDKGGQGEQG